MSGGEMASSSPAHRHNSTECRCWYYLALLHIFLRYTLQFTVHYNTLRNVQKIIIWILKFQPRLKTGNFYSSLSVNKTGSLHYITLTIHRWQTQTTELDEHSVTVLLMKWKSNTSDYYIATSELYMSWRQGFSLDLSNYYYYYIPYVHVGKNIFLCFYNLNGSSKNITARLSHLLIDWNDVHCPMSTVHLINAE